MYEQNYTQILSISQAIMEGGNATVCIIDNISTEWPSIERESVLWLSHCPRLVSLIVLTDNAEIADIAIFPEPGPGTHHASALRRLREGHDFPSQLLLKLSNQISRKSLLSLDIYLKWYIFSYFTSWNIWRNFSNNWSPSCPPDLELTSIRNVTLGEDILLESLFSIRFNNFHSKISASFHSSIAGHKSFY